MLTTWRLILALALLPAFVRGQSTPGSVPDGFTFAAAGDLISPKPFQLTPDQQARAEPLLRAYRDKMQLLRQERERLEQDLLGNLKGVLEPAQYEKLLAATKSPENQPPPSPPAR